MTRIHDLLQLPQSVRKGDFVQSLASGIERPQQTVDSYAITPAITHTFEHSLTIIDSALKTGASQAAYLHGSFGSGKSHFMAVLDLMLDNHPAPWARGELHALKAKFEWIGQRKLLQLPMHFLNATSIEEKVFDTYVRWLEVHHPEAPVPALYADGELLANAQSLRRDLGDERFFEKLNLARSVSPKWGKLAAGGWDGRRFEAAVGGYDDRERRELFSDLVKTHFPAFARQTGRFIELDRGLQVMASHAKALGYDGVVLYLDELILWLASSASDLQLIQRETKKLVNLKEGQSDRREIPIVSFIARQRDLVDLVGEHVRGDERAALEDGMKHHGGRFETVMLADSNLPAIVEHRVVRPKDAAARDILDDGFARVWRSAGGARSTLVGSVGNEAAFKQVFPFSPALVESLVALSDCLQRERTALRILMELLVEHLPELELGTVVPVGDAFDVIAGGEEPFDQALRARFARARDLYEGSFLPVIRSEHSTETAATCQRLRDGFPRKLGCSGCPNAACRNDNRLAKTLLMAALVPGAETFKDLTVRKLVHLNHGTIASPIPGAEVQLAASKLRRWGAQVGPLRVGDETDPKIALHLEGVDLAPIVSRAREFDNPGARKQKLRRLLFKDLGLPPDTTTVEHTVVYRGIPRKGLVRFGNVREMSDSQLTCPEAAHWYVILDYPFDQGGHSPEHDVLRIDAFLQASAGRVNPAVAWLPTFFSHKLEQTLGDYIAIDHILDGRQQEYLGHLRPEDQIQARGDLRSLRDQKRDQIVRALRAAYGVAQQDNSLALDPSRSVEDHFVPLSSALRIGPLLAGSLEDGMVQVIERILEKRYPHHPQFEFKVTNGKLEHVRVLLERLLESPDRRLPVTSLDRKELHGIADALGLTDTTEVRCNLKEQVFNDLEQRRQQAGLDSPTVTDVRGYTDAEGSRGLTPEVQDLIVWVYALWSGRNLVRAGREAELTRLGQLPGEAQLVRPDLPSEQEWHAALKLAGELFGVTFANRHLSARSLSALCQKVGEAAAKQRPAGQLPAALHPVLQDWAPAADAPRYTTAQSAAMLVDLVDRNEGAELVRALAAFEAQTSTTSVCKSLLATSGVLTALRSQPQWLMFQSVRAALNEQGKAARAAAILEDLSTTLRADELNTPLVAGLSELTRRAAELLRKPPGPREPGWERVHDERRELSGAAGYAEAMRALADVFSAKAEELEARCELKLEISVVLSKRERKTQ